MIKEVVKKKRIFKKHTNPFRDSKKQFILMLMLMLIGALNYIPIFCNIGILNNFYYEYKVFIISITLILCIGIYLSNMNKFNFSIVLSYIILLLLSGKLRQFDNMLIIKFNDNKNINEYYSPVLGYKKDNLKIKNTRISFKYNKGKYSYLALVYQPNHSYTKDNSIDKSFVKSFNRDWWLLNEDPE